MMPNNFFSFSPSILSDNLIPNNIPDTAIEEKINTTFQFTSACKSPKKPINELTVIMTKEVFVDYLSFPMF